MFRTSSRGKSYDEQSPASVCESVKIFNNCRRFVKSKSRHECETAYCKICRSQRPSNHFCFMRPLRCKVVTENPGEDTNGTTAQEDTTSRGKNESEGRANYKYKRNHCIYFLRFQNATGRDVKKLKTYKFTFRLFAQQICETCAGIKNMSVRCRWCEVCEFIFPK